MTDAQAERWEPLVKEHGLSKAAVEALAPAMSETIHEAIQAQHAATIGAWQDETRADKELGGENYDRSLGEAEAFVLRYAGKGAAKGDEQRQAQETLEFLRTTGGIHHPALRRLLVVADRATRPDGGPTGGSAPKQTSVADRMAALYPNSPEMFKPKE